MSGIYIKGMEMPRSCTRCELLKNDRSSFYCPVQSKEANLKANLLIELYANCPLIHVPDHGRLIDAGGKTFPTPHRNPSNDYMKGWNACLRSVHQQPTIIPADKEE